MYSIKNNYIKLTRGDTMPFEIEVRDEETEEIVELAEGDVVAFTLKKKVTDETPVLQKFGKHIVIEHEDTKDLDFGQYFYDVQITFEDGRVLTIIAPNEGIKHAEPNFMLTVEVNWE